MRQNQAPRLRKPLSTAATSVGIVLLAAILGGVLIALSGRDPFQTYGAILAGAGLNWFIPGQAAGAAFGLQQTLVLLVPLVLLGYAVAIPFRAGMFNIGGQGQYFIGSYAAVVVATSFQDISPVLHIAACFVTAAIAAGIWAAIAGLLRAYLGTSEVIVTIMLNYIAIWIGTALFGLGGPLQNSAHPTQPVSDPVAESAKIPVIWGSAALQGLHAGIFLVPIAVVLVWLFLQRSTAGFETRAVGMNPEAARYLGIPVAWRGGFAFIIGGAVAGIAGAVTVLGWQYQISVSDLSAAQLGFVGIAVALLGRNTPFGVFFSACLFAVLLSGTSSRNLDPSAFPPELAGYLALIGQAVIILLVSLDATRGAEFIRGLSDRISRWKAVKA